MSISRDLSNSHLIQTTYFDKLTTALNQKNRVETPYLFAVSIIAARNFETMHKRKCPKDLFEQPIKASIRALEDSRFKKVALERFETWIQKGLVPFKKVTYIKPGDCQPNDEKSYNELLNQDVENWDRKIPLSMRLREKPSTKFSDLFVDLTKALEINTVESHSQAASNNRVSGLPKLTQASERSTLLSFSLPSSRDVALENTRFINFSPPPSTDPFLEKFCHALLSQNGVETPQLLATAIIAAKKMLKSQKSCPGLLYPLQSMINSLKNSPFKKATVKRLRDWVTKGLGTGHVNVLEGGGYSPEYFRLIHEDLLRERNISLAYRVGETITAQFIAVFNECSQPLIGIPATVQKENMAPISSRTTGKKRRRDEASNPKKNICNRTTQTATSATVASLSQEHFSQSSAPSTSEPDLTFISPFTESLFSYLSPEPFLGPLTSDDVAASYSDSLPDSGSIEEMSISEVSSAFDRSLSGSFDTESHSTQSSLFSPTYFEQDFSTDSTSFDTNNHSSFEAVFEENSSDEEYSRVLKANNLLDEPAPKRQKTLEDQDLDWITDEIDSWF